MSEYAPAMVMPAVMPAVAPQVVVAAPKPQPKPQPKAMAYAYGKDTKTVVGDSSNTMYKLAMTLIVVLGMGTWVWGSMKFHKCGSGWLVAILKQMGVSLAVSFGYAAAAFSIVSLISIWNKKAATKTALTMYDPVIYGLTVSGILIAVNMAIFREKCRL